DTLNKVNRFIDIESYINNLRRDLKHSQFDSFKQTIE
ncbi:hypothetical protein SS7213T_03000, partial [Staphylococcus simiae CCM 7213 = CCUG 51256]